MASVLQVATIKDSGGNANAIEIANSSANVTINQLTASTKFPAGGTGNPISVAIITDQKGATDDGGESSTSFTARVLNTKSDPDSIATIGSNQITLGAGTYVINWSCPVWRSSRHQTQLYDITGSAALISGSSEYSYNTSSNYIVTRSMGSFVHSPTSNNVYEIRHRVDVAKSTDGLGVDSNMGVNSVYTIVVIYKLK